MTPGKAGAERSDFPLRKGMQVQQGEEMPGDNTDRTDGQQGQDERAPSFRSPRVQCPQESHNKKAQEKKLACHLMGSGAGVHRHIKRAVQRKLTVVFQTTGKCARAPLKIRTCPPASTGRKNSEKREVWDSGIGMTVIVSSWGRTEWGLDLKRLERDLLARLWRNYKWVPHFVLVAALSQVNDRCKILSQIQIHVPMYGFDDKYWLTNVLENDELSTYKTEN